MTTTKTLKRQILADALRAHAFAIERTGYQSEHERLMVINMREAAQELAPPMKRAAEALKALGL